MPIPKRVARWNRAGLNRVVRHVAPWMPGLGLVVHRGRRSGRQYRTPVELFPAEGGVIIALTYGKETDWLRNIQAAGSGEVRTRGRVLRVSEPRVYRDETRQGIRPAERAALRLLGVADFVYLKTAPGANERLRSSIPGQPVPRARRRARHVRDRAQAVTAAGPGRRRRPAARRRAAAGLGSGGARRAGRRA